MTKPDQLNRKSSLCPTSCSASRQWHPLIREYLVISEANKNVSRRDPCRKRVQSGRHMTRRCSVFSSANSGFRGFVGQSYKIRATSLHGVRTSRAKDRNSVEVSECALIVTRVVNSRNSKHASRKCYKAAGDCTLQITNSKQSLLIISLLLNADLKPQFPSLNTNSCQSKHGDCNERDP
jgi:hypothetical protein